MNIGLADFADPTLLIVGDAEAFRELGGHFASRRHLDLAAFQSVRLINLSSLLLDPVDKDGEFSCDGPGFHWTVSRAEADQFSEQLQRLAASGGPAHAYLDPRVNRTGIQIVASLGEYESAAVFAAP